jgi:hypothetical protein
MRETTAFFSTCPTCKHPRLQNGYERIELVESLAAGQAIDAYCLQCDVVWPISAQERFLIARGIIQPLHDLPPLRKRLQ